MGTRAGDVQLSDPEGLAFDAAGNLYVSEFGDTVVVEVGTSGALTTFAAGLASPAGLAFDARESLYVADHYGNRIVRVDSAGVVTTVAGTGADGSSGDGGPALSAELNDPIGIAFDADGNLYIADEQSARVRKVDTAGVITTFAGGGVRDPGDGRPATDAALSHPSYVAIDAAGSVYFSDFLANRVRRVDRAGVITTVAGTGSAGFAGDGGPAIAAELSFPTGIAFDRDGNLYISDADNNRIRKVDRAGVITTVAGTGEAGLSGDGGPATEAELAAPAGLALDADGNLYVADQDNDRVREGAADGIITTVAGGG